MTSSDDEANEFKNVYETPMSMGRHTSTEETASAYVRSKEDAKYLQTESANEYMNTRYTQRRKRNTDSEFEDTPYRNLNPSV